jgi:hypothetical protein
MFIPPIIDEIRDSVERKLPDLDVVQLPLSLVLELYTGQRSDEDVRVARDTFPSEWREFHKVWVAWRAGPAWCVKELT